MSTLIFIVGLLSISAHLPLTDLSDNILCSDFFKFPSNFHDFHGDGWL